MTQFTRKNFSDRFINEHNFSILDKKQQVKYYRNAMFVIVFLIISLFINTFFPFTFIHEFGIIKFVIGLIPVLIAIISFIILIIQEYKFNIFRKKYCFFILFLTYFIIFISGVINAQYNTVFIIDSVGNLLSHTKILFFFVIFLPLYFTDIIFSWSAYLGSLAKYINKK